MTDLRNIAFFNITGVMFFVCIFFSLSLTAQQYNNSGYHHDHAQQKATESDMPSVCEHLQVLLKHHEHDQAHELIIETINENPVQPDCFYYNARLYYNHKLAGREKHSKPLFDSLLVLYDKWFATSRNPANVLNSKGVDIRDYYYKQPDSLRKYCALYKRIYDSDRNSLHPYNLKMMAFCSCDLYGKVSIDTLWQFTMQKAMQSHDHLWKASYRSLKRELIRCPKMNCNQLNSYLHPELISGKEGAEENEKVAALLVKRGCAAPEGFVVKPAVASDKIKGSGSSDETSGINAKTSISKVKPLAEQSLNVFETLMKTAKDHMNKGNFSGALKNFDSAAENASTPIEKADGYLGMAVASDSLKDYRKAKEYSKIVHHLLPDETEGMKYLSGLYQKGERICNFKSATEQAAFYILLSDIAWSLSNSEESDAWKENANLQELYKSGQAKKGDKIVLGCFIEEEVELP